MVSSTPTTVARKVYHSDLVQEICRLERVSGVGKFGSTFNANNNIQTLMLV